MEQSKVEMNRPRILLDVQFRRRDFRRAKFDPTTGQVVVNPIIWLEMKDTIDIVWQYL